uniref:Uncharacterized protein n=1 Tax=Tetraselmis sp. GSL018 TaxID=582737 RepID=A0A061QTX5_9CHLO|mmetsp:Transcript_41083/g.97605  ORF Transcript_41083/g.97605 Transcript_41083/m.97605 type:complete len:202 (+) Transcript_41083:157-762(+)
MRSPSVTVFGFAGRAALREGGGFLTASAPFAAPCCPSDFDSISDSLEAYRRLSGQFGHSIGSGSESACGPPGAPKPPRAPPRALSSSPHSIPSSMLATDLDRVGAPCMFSRSVSLPMCVPSVFSGRASERWKASRTCQPASETMRAAPSFHAWIRGRMRYPKFIHPAGTATHTTFVRGSSASAATRVRFLTPSRYALADVR